MKNNTAIKIILSLTTTLCIIYGIYSYTQFPPMFSYEYIMWPTILLAWIISLLPLIISDQKRFNSTTALIINIIILIILITLRIVGKTQHFHYMNDSNTILTIDAFITYIAIQLAILAIWTRKTRNNNQNNKLIWKILVPTTALLILFGAFGICQGEHIFAKPANFQTIQKYSSASNLISASKHHYAVVNQNRTVTAKGNNTYGQCDVEKWRDIASVTTSEQNTYGLTTKGTIKIAGTDTTNKSRCTKWQNITQIAATDNTIFGLNKNGTLSIAGDSSFEENLKKIGNKKITQIVAGEVYISILTKDGTVITIEEDSAISDSISESNNWKNIEALSRGYSHLAAITKDGTVLVAGEGFYGQCEFNNWKKANAVWAGFEQTTIINTDGTINALGMNNDLLNELKKERNVRAVVNGVDFITIMKTNGDVKTIGNT